MDLKAKSPRTPAVGRSSLTRVFSVGYIMTLQYFRMLDRASGSQPPQAQEAQQAGSWTHSSGREVLLDKESGKSDAGLAVLKSTQIRTWVPSTAHTSMNSYETREYQC